MNAGPGKKSIRLNRDTADLFPRSAHPDTNDPVARLTRAIAGHIVREALSAHTSLSLGQIEAQSSIDELGPNSAEAADTRANRSYRRADCLCSIFLIDAFSDAQKVGDHTDLLLGGTESGWPKR